MKIWRNGLIVALLLGLSAAKGYSTSLPALPKLDLSSDFAGVSRQISEANAAAHAQPNDPEANGKLGMILDTYQQYAAAAICYRRAHQLAPTEFKWLYDLAYVEMKLGQYRRAVTHFRMVVKTHPDYMPAQLHLAGCLLYLHQLAESRAVYEEIVKKYPGNPEGFYGLGRTEAEQGDTKEAAAAFQKACELFPRYEAAHYALAMAYRTLGQAQKAKEQFAEYRANTVAVPPEVDPLRAAVQQLDQTPAHYLQRGLDLEQAGDLQGAIKAHLEAIKLDPNFVQPYINLIQLYARAGEYEKAEQEYRAAVRLNPHRSDCYYNYGVLMFDLKKYTEAETAFRRSIANNPYYAQAHNNLGALLEMQGHLHQALNEYRQAVQARPDYRLAHFHIGQILANQGDFKGAIQEFQKTLTLDDARTPTFLLVLGITYARAGDSQNAVTYLQKAEAEAAARHQTSVLASVNHILKEVENHSSSH